jgi:glycosyltransferase involved in cell wall biosynthesis
MINHITHIITGLDTGGAEMMLYKLLLKSDKSRFSANVISLTNIGPVGDRIQTLGIPVTALGINARAPNPWAIVRIGSYLRQMSTDIVQTWMYHADLIGGVAARLAGKIPVVWGIRHTTLNPDSDKRSTILVVKACSKLSKWIPTKIVCCAEASRSLHVLLGYDEQKMLVIQNGFDLDRFCPNKTAYREMRKELHIPEETLLIALIGRFHPQKGHRTFIEAAARLHTCHPVVHFVLCGDNVTWNNPDLVNWIDSAGIHGQCHLLGCRDDMPRIQASLDIGGTSASHGEAFPNVIGEAMACGIPCVVTDVGDSAFIVGDTGIVVPPENPDELAQAWKKMISLGRDGRLHLGEQARQRIRKNFDLHLIVRQYEELYDSVLGS